LRSLIGTGSAVILPRIANQVIAALLRKHNKDFLDKCGLENATSEFPRRTESTTTGVQNTQQSRLDAAKTAVLNAPMRVWVPPSLLKKRKLLQLERQDLEKRLSEITVEIGAVDYAMKVIDPDYVAPTAPAKRPSATSRLPVGTISQSCLEYLRDRYEAYTGEITESIKKAYGVELKTHKERHAFGAPVATALRRYQRKGIVELVGRNKRTREFKWRLCGDASPESLEDPRALIRGQEAGKG